MSINTVVHVMPLARKCMNSRVLAFATGGLAKLDARLARAPASNQTKKKKKMSRYVNEALQLGSCIDIRTGGN